MMRGWILSPALPLALAAIGTLALIYSWVHQNRELVRAYEEMSRLQRSQLVIDTDEVARDQWLIALDQEMTKQKPDEEFLAVAAHGALEGFLRWQTHMEGRVTESPEEYAKELAARDFLLRQAEGLAQTKDYRALMAVLQKLTVTSRDLHSTAELDKRFFAKVDAANDKIAESEGSVRSWYVIGTASLLLSTILASIFLEVTLRRIELQTHQVKPHSSKRKG
jgi:hypothetical protein